MVGNAHQCDPRNKDTPHSGGKGFVRNLKDEQQNGLQLLVSIAFKET